MTVRRALVISGLCLLGQVSLTDYGYGTDGGGFLWLVLGLALLWLVERRRSRVARGVVVVSSLSAAVVYALLATDLPANPRAWLLAVLCAGQAVPLLLPVVRDHVARRTDERAPLHTEVV